LEHIWFTYCTFAAAWIATRFITHWCPGWQTFILTQDYEWESSALKLTVPKTPSVQTPVC